ncbi:MAG: hypothetical protein DRI86_04970 [Bacteroidetes bacterium]|nr:MAG: hypothetical protein DRI86_04970 [Bacteroidota bacterium]
MKDDSKMYVEIKASSTIAYYKKYLSLGAAHGGYYNTTYKYIPGFSLGIRRQAPNGWFYYHINMQISYDKELSSSIVPMLGLGIGNTF